MAACDNKRDVLPPAPAMKPVAASPVVAPPAAAPPVAPKGAEEPVSRGIPEPPPAPNQEPAAVEQPFAYQVDRFADLRVLRFQVPGFEALDLQKKALAYYLYEAALAGRDLIWDQNYRHNLFVRAVLGAVVRTYQGDRGAEPYKALLTYAKRVWFSGGIHHHYSTKKIDPGFDRAGLATLLAASTLPPGWSAEQVSAELGPVLFDPAVAAQRVSLNAKADLIASSATNFYGPGLTQKEVEAYYKERVKPDDPRPLSWGLNSRLVRGPDGKLVEEVWKVGGAYTEAIEKIVAWLEKAVTVAENDAQKRALELLVAYYKTGDLKTFDDYSIAWVKDTGSTVEVINGFIEVYGDPLSMRGSFESVVSIRDAQATQRIATIGANAQWFEDHSPIPDEYKKKDVKGIDAKVITVVVAAGDSSPTLPIGINLPNANWIRVEHGSKSVSLGNISRAHEEASKESGLVEEFSPNPEVAARLKKHGELGDLLHTDMHEAIGHASGQLRPGVDTPQKTLQHYGSTLEEARADLVALYFLMDPKLVELGLMESLEVGKAAYDDYVQTGMLRQLARIEPGEKLEESHMRNRQLIAKWAFEKGQADGVVVRFKRDGKTYFQVNDFERLRTLWGQLLREIQRIKSEGDFEAAKALVESYGVEVDQEVLVEVRGRYKRLDIPPFSGFLNPKLEPVYDGDRLADVKLSYPDDFVAQMLEYDQKYGFLPVLRPSVGAK
jgi:dipeptidyl-peptidase-3